MLNRLACALMLVGAFLGLVSFALLVNDRAREHAEDRAARCESASRPRTDIELMPPIRNCPEDVELWKCIREGLYRRDI